MNTVTTLNADVVREAARGRWRHTIYPALNINVGNGKHGPCPVCGGKDRFRCDDKDGSGSHFCNQCGAGDGFTLIQKTLGCLFPEALQRVAETLGVTPSSSYPRPLPKLKRVDRVAVAFRFELAALDLRLRADRILEVGKSLHVATMTNEELDRALSFVASAYADLHRAELFEGVADDLRTRDYDERMDREQHRRTA